MDVQPSVIFLWAKRHAMDQLKKSKKQASDGAKFIVTMSGGEKIAMEPTVAYGSFITEVRNATSYLDLSKLIGASGLTMKSVKPLLEYLDLSQEKIADLIGVSSRTLSRWKNDSTIGILPSKALLEIDRISRKGIETFGDADLFKAWLYQSNIALGDVTPIDMLAKPYGIELVEGALEALDHGNIL